MTDEERKALEEKLKAEAEARAKADYEAKLAEERRKARAEAETGFKAELKAVTGHEDLGALKTEREKAEQKRLADEGKFKELADQAGESARGWEAKYKTGRIDAVLTDVAIKAGAIDTDVVRALLGAQAVCDDEGQVTIDGKAPAEAVKELLEAKPHLAKAEGTSGSGSGAGKPKPKGDENPWLPGQINLTTQAEIYKESPDQARKLMAAAGVEPW